MVYCHPAKGMLEEAIEDRPVAGAGNAIDGVGEVLRLQNHFPTTFSLTGFLGPKSFIVPDAPSHIYFSKNTERDQRSGAGFSWERPAIT